ncbi:MAG: hypothetical protein M5R36_08140 [Deltaproteobacteria bacterium]|nr:hypothetical protein [Deltaproteobacteria bacterium]
MRFRWGGNILMALAVTLVAAGCGPTLEDYYPLQVGNTWTYKTVYPDGRTRTDVDQLFRRVEQTYFFNNGEVLVRLRDMALLNRNGMRVLRYPLKKGTRWEDREIQCEITSKGDRYVLPAGEFADTLTVVWKSARRAPVTMSADAFTRGPRIPDGREPPPREDEEEDEYPMRTFEATTVYARGVGPIVYKLRAAEEGAELRDILTSELQSFETKNELNSFSLDTKKRGLVDFPRVLSERSFILFFPRVDAPEGSRTWPRKKPPRVPPRSDRTVRKNTNAF